jgi:hypothetical protein
MAATVRLQTPAGLPLLVGDTRQTAVAWVSFWQGAADEASAALALATVASALGATLAASVSYASDAAAAAGGIAVGGLYRSGSVVCVRVA